MLSNSDLLRIFLFAAFIFISFSSSAFGAIRGNLLLRVACYNHSSNMHLNAQSKSYRSCDSNNSHCDPSFEFCLSTINTYCQMPLAKKTFKFSDKSLLGECAKHQSGDNFPMIINMTVDSDASPSATLYLYVKVDEIDRTLLQKRSHEIDSITFELDANLPTVGNRRIPKPSEYSQLNIYTRTSNGQFKPQFDLRGLMQCPYQRYGPYCTSSCVPTHQYTCSGNGTKVCKSGWRGSDCTQPDQCVSKPCKSWAECRIKEPDSFICICDGRTGPQCIRDTDPCLNHRCANNATCSGKGRERRPVCQCKPGWRGKLCTQRDPCWPNRCGPSGRCIVVSSNDSKSTMHCVCEKGYDGEFCELRLATPKPLIEPDDSPNLILVFGIAAGFALLGIIMMGSICFYQNRNKNGNKGDRREFQRTSSVTYRAPILNTTSTCNEYLYDIRCESGIYDEIGQETYEEPGRVYSVDEDDETCKYIPPSTVVSYDTTYVQATPNYFN